MLAPNGSEAPAPCLPSKEAKLDFDEVYDTHADFVWRNARRLGVDAAALDDVMQDVFVVVHRRLHEQAPGTAIAPWLFGILVRVVRDYRRGKRRKDPFVRSGGAVEDPETVQEHGDDPEERAQKGAALRILHEVLGELEEDKREVFILAELEQMSVPEISAALGINANTAYSRLRAARKDFERAVARVKARDEWRLS